MPASSLKVSALNRLLVLLAVFPHLGSYAAPSWSTTVTLYELDPSPTVSLVSAQNTGMYAYLSTNEDGATVYERNILVQETLTQNRETSDAQVYRTKQTIVQGASSYAIPTFGWNRISEECQFIPNSDASCVRVLVEYGSDEVAETVTTTETGVAVPVATLMVDTDTRDTKLYDPNESASGGNEGGGIELVASIGMVFAGTMVVGCAMALA